MEEEKVSEISPAESVYDRLHRLASEAGVSLLAICKKTGIARSTVERWKGQEPRTVVMIRDLEKAIAEAARKKANR